MLHFCCYQVSVNGSNEHPIFKHLKAALPLPQVGPSVTKQDKQTLRKGETKGSR